MTSTEATVTRHPRVAAIGRALAPRGGQLQLGAKELDTARESIRATPASERNEVVDHLLALAIQLQVADALSTKMALRQLCELAALLLDGAASVETLLAQAASRAQSTRTAYAAFVAEEPTLRAPEAPAAPTGAPVKAKRGLTRRG